MAKRIFGFTTEDAARGFIVGVEFVNDSALEIVSFECHREEDELPYRVVVEDQDRDDDDDDGEVCGLDLKDISVGMEVV